MLEAVYAIIYGALLSAKLGTGGTCKSSRSVAKVVRAYALGRESNRKNRKHECGNNNGTSFSYKQPTQSLARHDFGIQRNYLKTNLRSDKLSTSSLCLRSRQGTVLPCQHIALIHSYTHQMSPQASSSNSLSSSFPTESAISQAWIRFDALWASRGLHRLSLQDITDFATFVCQYPVISLKNDQGHKDLMVTRFKELQNVLMSREYPPESTESRVIDIWVKCLAVIIALLSENQGKIRESFVRAALFPEHDTAVSVRIMCLEQLFRAYCSKLSRGDSLVFLATVWPKLRQFLIKGGGELKEAAKRLSDSIADGWGSYRDARDLIRVQNEQNCRIAMDIFIFAYGSRIPSPALEETFRTLTTAMPLEVIVHILETFLDREAHVEACLIFDMLNERTEVEDIQLQQMLQTYELTHAGLRDLANIQAKERFLSCNSSMSCEELVFVWQSMELLKRSIDFEDDQERNAAKNFADLLVQKSRVSFVNNRLTNAVAIVNCLEWLLSVLPPTEHPRSKEISLAELQLKTLKGEWAAVRDTLSCLSSDDASLVHGLNQLLLTAFRLNGIKGAFLNAIELYRIILRYLRLDDARFLSERHSQLHEPLSSFHESLLSMFCQIEDPSSLIADMPSHLRNDSVGLFLEIYRYLEKDVDRIETLLIGLRARRVLVSYTAYVHALIILVDSRRFEQAKRVFQMLHSQFPDIVAQPSQRSTVELLASLKLASFQGDTKTVEEMYKIMNSRESGLLNTARQYFLHAHAISGTEEEFHRIWEKTFESGQQPTERDMQELLLVHSRAGNVTASADVLDRIKSMGLKVNMSMYNMMLVAFAKRRDLNSAANLLDKLLESEVKPNVRSFTIVMSIMADLCDVVGAERLYNLALSRGLVPDAHMVVTLMDAHISATSWRGAIRVFDHIDGRIKKDRQVASYLYTSLLKAYVNIGSPFKVVLKLFGEMKRLGIRPTLETYTTVIKAACDAGQMRRANDLFKELKSLLPAENGPSPVDTRLMTTLIYGYVKNGDMAGAWDMYDNMLEHNLEPEPFALASMIQFYTKTQVETGLLPEESFIINALDHYKGEERARALDGLYSPLLAVFTKREDIETVERLFTTIVNQGGTPSISSLAILMDAYRRAERINDVEAVWNMIIDKASHQVTNALEDKLKSLDDANEWQVSPHGSAICIPLSIYIKALSAAGQHLKIAQVWQQVRQLGFAYDAHNWNHLAIALVHAGEVERAFEIVERVLLPWEIQAQMILRKRYKKPKWPLSFVKAPKRGSVETRSPTDMQEAAEGAEETIDSVYLPSTGKRQRRINNRQYLTENYYTEARVSEWDSADPVQALFEMQQMVPVSQGWRSHNRLLDLLYATVEVLGTGKLLRPTKPMGDESTSADRGVMHDSGEEAEMATVMIVRIQESFPMAFRAVESYGRKKRELMGTAALRNELTIRRQLLAERDKATGIKQVASVPGIREQPVSRGTLGGMQEEWVGSVNKNTL